MRVFNGMPKPSIEWYIIKTKQEPFICFLMSLALSISTISVRKIESLFTAWILRHISSCYRIRLELSIRMTKLFGKLKKGTFSKAKLKFSTHNFHFVCGTFNKNICDTLERIFDWFIFPREKTHLVKFHTLCPATVT